jgi:transposase-like protein
MTSLSDPIFTDETAARDYLEGLRWADGRFCPHCGEAERTSPVKGKSHRPGLYVCLSCKKQFTVRIGTIFERSHIPLHKWVAGFYLMSSSKKGISAHQLHRMLGITYKSAWFMAHRIRESMRETKPSPIGGKNKVVEADETFVGGKSKNRKNKVPPKEAVFSLVEREGRVRSFHVPAVTADNLRPILVTQASRKSYLMTDESNVYTKTGREFAGHGTVNHSIEEYVRGKFWHTNTMENYFSIMKRGITGVYHHTSQAHLKRYLAEYDFRYNERAALGIDDAERTARAIKGAEGKRLTYQQPRQAQA